jgi:hypothetical protein
MNFNSYRPEKKKSFWHFGKKAKILFLALFFLLIIILIFAHQRKFFLFEKNNSISKNLKNNISPETSNGIGNFIPGPISMDLIKKNGCVVDGFLSGYGGKVNDIADMVERSRCVYLHRALETWLSQPDFEKATSIMQKVKKRPLVYGMFIAEALSTRGEYIDPNWNYNFNFDKMCRKSTKNRWGNDTCIPSINNVEYRRYLKSITHRAMDIGIQSFLFGQIKLQDSNHTFEGTQIKKVLDDMRAYAKEKNMQIIIGAQTNDIADDKYLRLFDYIEGGVGINSAGNVENQPCSSKFSGCWGLLWNSQYSTKANNVFLHLDWSGYAWDDMDIFAKMNQANRIATLRNLYQKFTSQNMGFLMPFLAVLNHENGGCSGPNKNFYTPSNKYNCNDEAMINQIMPEIK